MSLHAMPLVVMNLGAEMVYILEQRLHAQNIAPTKRDRVLQDVLRAMFHGRFVAELFKPQELYNSASLRGLFDRLAHSSIMRLSKSSMDKLYDLMCMGFKYQLLRCSHPGQALVVTMNHLNALAALAERTGTDKASQDRRPKAADLINGALAQIHGTYDFLSIEALASIMQTLCRFFQERRVKVSLFLQTGIQQQDATMTLPRAGPVPPGFAVPGTIHYLGRTAPHTETFAPAIQATDDPPPPCVLGENLYAKSRSPPPPSGTGSPAGAHIPPPAHAPPAVPAADPAAAAETTATAEMDLLSHIVGHRETPDAFVVDLFAGMTAFSSGAAAAAPGAAAAAPDGEAAGPAVESQRMGRSADSRAVNTALASVMDDFAAVAVSGGGGAGAEEDEDDLLALMDS